MAINLGFANLKRLILNEADVAKSLCVRVLCQKSKRGLISCMVSHSTVVLDQKEDANLLNCIFCNSAKSFL